jgi:membrane protein implicated in regulation of membrane protease activity
MEATFMEPQEVFYCKEKKEKCNNNKCFGIVTIILAIALAFVVGLLVGAAAIASEILASFAAIIVLAVILALLLILSIIIIERKTKKKNAVTKIKK